MLFTASNSAGTSEIRLSKPVDGRDATTVTPGSEALWLGNGEEFLYNVDSGHAAVFSLRTMSMALLRDPGRRGHQMIAEKAVSPHAKAIALLLANDRAEWTVVVYEGDGFEHVTAFALNAARRIQFDSSIDRLFVSLQLPGSASTLTILDWKAEKIRHAGRYQGFDLTDVMAGEERKTIVVGATQSNDLWLYGRFGRRRLTTDGENLWGSMSPSGDLLLSKRMSSGQYVIWLQGLVNPPGR